MKKYTLLFNILFFVKLLPINEDSVRLAAKKYRPTLIIKLLQTAEITHEEAINLTKKYINGMSHPTVFKKIKSIPVPIKTNRDTSLLMQKEEVAAQKEEFMDIIREQFTYEDNPEASYKLKLDILFEPRIPLVKKNTNIRAWALYEHLKNETELNALDATRVTEIKSLLKDSSITNPNLQESPIHYYAAKGDLQKVKELKESGANLWAQDSVLNHPIHYAAAYNHVEIINYFQANKVCPCKRNIKQETVLMTACQFGSNEAISYLVSHNAYKLNQGRTLILERDIALRTALHHAVLNNHLGSTKILLEKASQLGILAELINKADAHGNTALHVAAQQDNFEIVQILLKYGATKNSYNLNFYQPYELTKNTQIKEMLTPTIKINKTNADNIISNLKKILSQLTYTFKGAAISSQDNHTNKLIDIILDAINQPNENSLIKVKSKIETIIKQYQATNLEQQKEFNKNGLSLQSLQLFKSYKGF